MITIHTRYRNNDATHVALALAKHLDRVGKAYAILRTNYRANNVSSTYDKVVRNRDKHNPAATFAFWTYIDAQEIVFKHKNTFNILFTSWDQLHSYDEFILDLYDFVLIPTMVQAKSIHDFMELDNLGVIPVDYGYSFTKKRELIESDKIHLCMPIYGKQINRTTISSFLIMSDIVELNPNVHLTILCPNKIPRDAQKLLDQYNKAFPTRWKTIQGASWDTYVRAMLLADLTIWPVLYDGLGLIPVVSTTLGTPVVAWDIAPTNEYLQHRENCYLVDCTIEKDWPGIQHAIPDHDAMTRTILDLIRSKDMLYKLKASDNKTLVDHNTEFHAGLEALLE